MTLIFAHRGASAAATGNTVAAFARAVEMGADGVELDVRRTADDHLVVHHDPALADGRAIRATRRDDLPPHVPSLDEGLAACEDLVVNIEIKNDPAEPDFDPNEWVAHRLATLLAGRGDPQRWLVSSFRFETVERVHRLWSSVRTAWLTVELGADGIDRVATRGHAAIHPAVGAVDRSGLREAHRRGIAVNVWTCNDPDRLAELIAWGVDGICTDVPDVALDVRRSVRPA